MTQFDKLYTSREKLVKTVLDLEEQISQGGGGGGSYPPSGGVPKTDLASSVQTSLDKADSAYQKPETGIPASDLASGIIPDVSGKEDTSNKTNDISTNVTSTTKYPTTKGVADYVEGELSDIENALDAILGGDTLSEEKKLTIVAASGTALTASVDNYYLFGSEVGTLAITLTTPSDTTHITKAVFMLTTGSSPAVTFAGASGINVIAQDGFSIEASTTYEINAIYNGAAWVVAAMTLSSTPINS